MSNDAVTITFKQQIKTDRRAAHGRLLQDAHVHAVDDEPVVPDQSGVRRICADHRLWSVAMGVLDDKVAIVTGSARGIGRATAELLTEHGAKVIINDLDADLAEQAASEIAGETAVYGGDLTKDDAPEALVQTAIDALGKIDIIVNNAGYTIDAPIHKMSDDAYQRMLDIHTIVPFRVIRAAAPHLREPAKAEREEGVEVFRKIVNVSSISGTMGNAGQANYASGKAAVVGLTKTLAKEWGQFKINVNAVAFGWIETRLTASKDADEHDGDRRREGAARHPGADARDGADADPDRPPGHAGGGRRRRVLPLLAVVELRPRPGAERHRRPVHGDDDMKLVKPSGEERDVPRGVVGGAEISQATTGAHNIYMGIFRVPAGLARPPALPRQLRERALHALRRDRDPLRRPARGVADRRGGRHALRPAARDAHRREPLRDRAGRVRRRPRLAHRGLRRGALGGSTRLT